jgi:hypothetical protein
MAFETEIPHDHDALRQKASALLNVSARAARLAVVRLYRMLSVVSETCCYIADRQVVHKCGKVNGI